MRLKEFGLLLALLAGFVIGAAGIAGTSLFPYAFASYVAAFVRGIGGIDSGAELALQLFVWLGVPALILYGVWTAGRYFGRDEVRRRLGLPTEERAKKWEQLDAALTVDKLNEIIRPFGGYMARKTTHYGREKDLPFPR